MVVGGEVLILFFALVCVNLLLLVLYMYLFKKVNDLKKEKLEEA